MPPAPSPPRPRPAPHGPRGGALPGRGGTAGRTGPGRRTWRGDAPARSGGAGPDKVLTRATLGVTRLFEEENTLRVRLNDTLERTDEVIEDYEGWLHHAANQRRPDLADTHTVLQHADLGARCWSFLKGHDLPLRSGSEVHRFQAAAEEDCLEKLIAAPLVETVDLDAALDLERLDTLQQILNDCFDGERAELQSRAHQLTTQVAGKVAQGLLSWGEAAKLQVDAACTVLCKVQDTRPPGADATTLRIRTLEGTAFLALEILRGADGWLAEVQEEAEGVKQQVADLRLQLERERLHSLRVEHQGHQARRTLLEHQLIQGHRFTAGPAAGQPFVQGARPVGRAAFVSIVIPNSGDYGKGLWDGDVPLMEATLRVFNEVVRSAIMTHHGHEALSLGDQTVAVLRHSEAALHFCEELQLCLLAAPWPPEALEKPSMQVLFDPDVTSIVQRGPPVSFAIHSGDLMEICDGNNDHCYGPAYNITRALGLAADPGEILLSEAAFSEVLGATSEVSTALHVEQRGNLHIHRSGEPIAVYRAIPQSLKGHWQVAEAIDTDSMSGGPATQHHTPNLGRPGSLLPWLRAKRAWWQHRREFTARLEEETVIRNADDAELFIGDGLTLVQLALEGGDKAWTEKCGAVGRLVRRFNALVRSVLKQHPGYVLHSRGDAVRLAFRHAHQAVTFCLAVQEATMGVEVDEELRAGHPEFGDLPGLEAPLFRGPRVRMAAHTLGDLEEAEVQYDCDRVPVDVAGPVLETCQALFAAALGGELLVSQRARQALSDQLAHVEPPPHVEPLPAGRKLPGNLRHVCLVLPSTLKERAEHLSQPPPWGAHPPAGDSALVDRWDAEGHRIEAEVQALDQILNHLQQPPPPNPHFNPLTLKTAAVLVCDIHSPLPVWDCAVGVLRDTLALYHAAVFRQVVDLKGAVAAVDGFRVVAAFPSLATGVRFGSEIQRTLNSQEWPAPLLALPSCAPEADAAGQTVLRGPRVGCGLDVGPVAATYPDAAGGMELFGPPVDRAEALQPWASVGETLVPTASFQGPHLRLAGFEHLYATERVLPPNVWNFKNVMSILPAQLVCQPVKMPQPEGIISVWWASQSGAVPSVASDDTNWSPAEPGGHHLAVQTEPTTLAALLGPAALDRLRALIGHGLAVFDRHLAVLRQELAEFQAMAAATKHPQLRFLLDRMLRSVQGTLQGQEEVRAALTTGLAMELEGDVTAGPLSARSAVSGRSYSRTRSMRIARQQSTFAIRARPSGRSQIGSPHQSLQQMGSLNSMTWRRETSRSTSSFSTVFRDSPAMSRQGTMLPKTLSGISAGIREKLSLRLNKVRQNIGTRESQGNGLSPALSPVSHRSPTPRPPEANLAPQPTPAPAASLPVEPTVSAMLQLLIEPIAPTSPLPSPTADALHAGDEVNSVAGDAVLSTSMSSAPRRSRWDSCVSLVHSAHSELTSYAVRPGSRARLRNPAQTRNAGVQVPEAAGRPPEFRAVGVQAALLIGWDEARQAQAENRWVQEMTLKQAQDQLDTLTATLAAVAADLAWVTASTGGRVAPFVGTAAVRARQAVRAIRARRWSDRPGNGQTADAPWPLEADTPAASLPAEATIVSSAEWLRFDRCVKRLKRALNRARTGFVTARIQPFPARVHQAKEWRRCLPWAPSETRLMPDVVSEMYSGHAMMERLEQAEAMAMAMHDTEPGPRRPHHAPNRGSSSMGSLVRRRPPPAIQAGRDDDSGGPQALLHGPDDFNTVRSPKGGKAAARATLGGRKPPGPSPTGRAAPAGPAAAPRPSASPTVSPARVQHISPPPPPPVPPLSPGGSRPEAAADGPQPAGTKPLTEDEEVLWSKALERFQTRDPPTASEEDTDGPPPSPQLSGRRPSLSGFIIPPPLTAEVSPFDAERTTSPLRAEPAPEGPEALKKPRKRVTILTTAGPEPLCKSPRSAGTPQEFYAPDPTYSKDGEDRGPAGGVEAQLEESRRRLAECKRELFNGHCLAREFCTMMRILLESIVEESMHPITDAMFVKRWVATVRKVLGDPADTAQAPPSDQEAYAHLLAGTLPTKEAEHHVRNHPAKLLRSLVGHLTQHYDTFKTFRQLRTDAEQKKLQKAVEVTRRSMERLEPPTATKPPAGSETRTAALPGPDPAPPADSGVPHAALATPAPTAEPPDRPRAQTPPPDCQSLPDIEGWLDAMVDRGVKKWDDAMRPQTPPPSRASTEQADHLADEGTAAALGPERGTSPDRHNVSFHTERKPQIETPDAPKPPPRSVGARQGPAVAPKLAAKPQRGPAAGPQRGPAGGRTAEAEKRPGKGIGGGPRAGKSQEGAPADLPSATATGAAPTPSTPGAGPPGTPAQSASLASWSATEVSFATEEPYVDPFGPPSPTDGGSPRHAARRRAERGRRAGPGRADPSAGEVRVVEWSDELGRTPAWELDELNEVAQLALPFSQRTPPAGLEASSSAPERRTGPRVTLLAARVPSVAPAITHSTLHMLQPDG